MTHELKTPTLQPMDTAPRTGEEVLLVFIPRFGTDKGPRPSLRRARNMAKISLQEYADNTVSTKYLHPLMTIQEALAKHGWEFVARPTCCDAEVEMDGFLGSIYQAWCDSCGKFVADVTGPTFQNGGGCVNIVDSDKVDVETDFERRWISGVRQDGL